jgi:hypothetical protein
MLKYDVVIGKTTNNPGTAVDVNALEITLYKSEELDFGVFTIPATTRFENFQILDRVDITVTDGSNTKVYDPFLVISDEVSPVSKKGFYKHTVTFIEDIHKFEKILTSSIFITQPLVGTKKTLLDVMNHIRDVVPFERTSVHTATRLFDIDTNLAAFLDTIEAPQFFFGGMGLREMINAVASYVNAIGRMEDNKNLVFSFYDEILNVIGVDEDVIYRTLRNQTKNFTSSVESDIENATGADDVNRANIVFPNEDAWITPRSNNVKLTDTNFEIRVPYPIERISRVYIRPEQSVVAVQYYEYDISDPSTPLLSDNALIKDTVSNNLFQQVGFIAATNTIIYREYEPTGVLNTFASPTNSIRVIQIAFNGNNSSTSNFIEFEILYIDVTSLVLIKEQWDRQALDVASGRATQNLKANTLFFSIGGTVISNGQLSGIFDNLNTLTAFYQRAMVVGGFSILTVDIEDIQFKITYVPYFGTRVRLNKDDVTDHPYNTQMSANQGERIVSAERLLRNIYGMAQRLGQDEIEFKRFYNDLDEMFELGDITPDGFVVASKHITYYLNYYMVNYLLSKNFNRFANRIALNQENRPFDIGLGSKTTNRNLLYNEYVELDTERKANTSLVRNLGVGVFMNTIQPSPIQNNNRPVGYGIISSTSMADITSSEGILVAPIAFSEGNSLNFYWSIEDILKAGDQLTFESYTEDSDDNEPPVIPVLLNRLIRYTDAQGGLENLELSFGNLLPDQNPDELPLVNIPSDSLALIGGHSVGGVFNDSFIVKKDKSESLSMNYILSVLPNYQYNNKIIAGRELIYSNNLIIANKNATLVVYTSTSDTYNSLENRYVKGVSTSYSITTTIDQGSGKVVVGIPSNVLTTLKSWAIGDSDGNLYLGVNVDTDVTTTIYFNFKNKRENISYTFDDIDIVGLVAPRNLVLTPTETTIAATWLDDQTSDFYEVGIRTIAPFIGGFTTITTTNKFRTFTGLVQGHTYQVRVRSSKDGVVSFYISASVSTSAEPPKVQEFTLTRIAGNNNSLLGSWNAATNVTGYNAQARLASVLWTAGSVVNQTLGSNQTTTTFNVGVNNILVGRVRGQNSFGFGAFSDEDINVIPSVTGRGATALSDTVIRASWNQLSNLIDPTVNQEIGFEIETTTLVELDSGTSTGGGVNQLSDTTKSFTPSAFVGKIIYIGTGPQAGKSATITANTATSITFTPQLTSSPQDLVGVEYSVLELNASTLTTDTVIHTAEFFDITGLTATTFYQVGIRAYYEYIDAQFGKTVYSDKQLFVVETLEVALPAQVLAPTVTTASGYPTQSEVRWNIFNSNNFEVSVAVDITTSATTPQSYSFTLPANSTIQRFQSGLPNNTTRVISVRFRVGTTPNFVFSNTTSNTQTTLPPPPPPVPTGLQVTNITQNSATASWNAVQSATNGYQVLVNPGGLLFGTASTNDSTSVSITGLTASTTFTAQVRSRGVDGSGASAYSAGVNFTTLSGVPAAPATATLTATGGPTWSLSWTSSSGATGYDYQIASNSNFTTIITNSSTVGVNSTSVSGSHIVGQRIYARVRATNASGASAYRLADPTGGVVLG